MNSPLNTDYETDRDSRGRFTGTPGPGRPKGSVGGRTMALKLLDKVLAEDATQERLAAALREYFEADPVRFFRQIIMPLLPSEMKMSLAEKKTFSWVPLPEVIRLRDGLEPDKSPKINPY